MKAFWEGHRPGEQLTIFTKENVTIVPGLTGSPELPGSYLYFKSHKRRPTRTHVTVGLRLPASLVRQPVYCG